MPLNAFKRLSKDLLNAFERPLRVAQPYHACLSRGLLKISSAFIQRTDFLLSCWKKSTLPRRRVENGGRRVGGGGWRRVEVGGGGWPSILRICSAPSFKHGHHKQWPCNNCTELSNAQKTNRKQLHGLRCVEAHLPRSETAQSWPLGLTYAIRVFKGFW